MRILLLFFLYSIGYCSEGILPDLGSLNSASRQERIWAFQKLYTDSARQLAQSFFASRRPAFEKDNYLHKQMRSFWSRRGKVRGSWPVQNELIQTGFAKDFTFALHDERVFYQRLAKIYTLPIPLKFFLEMEGKWTINRVAGELALMFFQRNEDKLFYVQIPLSILGEPEYLSQAAKKVQSFELANDRKHKYVTFLPSSFYQVLSNPSDYLILVLLGSSASLLLIFWLQRYSVLFITVQAAVLAVCLIVIIYSFERSLQAKTEKLLSSLRQQFKSDFQALETDYAQFKLSLASRIRAGADPRIPGQVVAEFTPDGYISKTESVSEPVVQMFLYRFACMILDRDPNISRSEVEKARKTLKIESSLAIASMVSEDSFFVVRGLFEQRSQGRLIPVLVADSKVYWIFLKTGPKQYRLWTIFEKDLSKHWLNNSDSQETAKPAKRVSYFSASDSDFRARISELEEKSDSFLVGFQSRSIPGLTSIYNFPNRKLDEYLLTSIIGLRTSLLFWLLLASLLPVLLFWRLRRLFQIVGLTLQNLIKGDYQEGETTLFQDELSRLATTTFQLSKDLKEQEDLQPFTAHELIPLFLNDSNQLEERCSGVGTVLFSDIRSFTTLCETYSADEIIELLNEYFNIWQKNVDRFGGVIQQFIGDAVVAVFLDDEGTSTRQQDALECSIRVQEELIDFLQKRRVDGQFLFRNGIGIARGSLDLNLVGSSLQKHLHLNSPVARKAETNEELSKAGTSSRIVVSEEIYSAMQGVYDFNEIDGQNVFELIWDQISFQDVEQFVK